MGPEGQCEWLARGVELHRKYALVIEWGTEVARMIDDLEGLLPTKNEVQLTLQTGPFATSLTKRAGLLLHLLAGRPIPNGMASQWGVTIPCVTESERKDFREYMNEYFISFRHFLVGLNATSATVDDIMRIQDRGGRMGTLYGKRREDLIEDLGGMNQDCGYCHKPLSPRDYAIAHRRPYVVEGDYEKCNLFLAHKTCNQQAGLAAPSEIVHMFIDWAEAPGRPIYSIALDAIAKWNALNEKLSYSQLFRDLSEFDQKEYLRGFFPWIRLLPEEGMSIPTAQAGLSHEMVFGERAHEGYNQFTFIDCLKELAPHLAYFQVHTVEQRVEHEVVHATNMEHRYFALEKRRVKSVKNTKKRLEERLKFLSNGVPQWVVDKHPNIPEQIEVMKSTLVRCNEILEAHTRKPGAVNTEMRPGTAAIQEFYRENAKWPSVAAIQEVFEVEVDVARALLREAKVQ